MKILVVSAEPWQKENNGGSVLESLFDVNQNIQQIYLGDELPNTSKCKKFLQISTRGLNVIENSSQKKNEYRNHHLEIKTFFKKYLFHLSFFAKDIYFLIIFLIRFKEIKEFVDKFKPDIMFLPTYGLISLNILNMKISKYYDSARRIGYISDDHTSYFRYFSPSFFIHRTFLRGVILKTMQKNDINLTMTKEHNELLKKKGIKGLVTLKKFDLVSQDKFIFSKRKSYRMIYAGSIYAGREHTLKDLEKTIVKINKKGINLSLDIFSRNKYSTESPYVKFKGSLSKEALDLQYPNYDFTLHIESLISPAKEVTKYSFSSKIIECLSTGKPFILIASKESSAYKYISENNLGIAINSSDYLIDKLFKYLNANSEDIMIERKKVFNFLKENHSEEVFKKEIKEIFKLENTAN